MLPGSRLLRDLARAPVPAGCEVLSIAGGADSIVPGSFSELSPAPGHRNLRLEGANHWQLLFARAGHALVGRALGAAAPIPVPGGARARIAA